MDTTIQVNEYLTKSITVGPNDKKTDLLVLTLVEFATGGQKAGLRFVMDRHMWQQVVDGLAANGVVAAAVGAVSA